MFQFRDVSVPVLERMEATLGALVQEANRRERCTVTLEPVSQAIPALCDPKMMQALADAAEEMAPGLWQQMPSGAGHDAQNIARRMPAAMLFVPSIGGISHHWAEDTKDEDLALGIQVLDRAARIFLAT
jgi:N-carbamoyl-L-amino-acid hydrolase